MPSPARVSGHVVISALATGSSTPWAASRSRSDRSCRARACTTCSPTNPGPSRLTLSAISRPHGASGPASRLGGSAIAHPSGFVGQLSRRPVSTTRRRRSPWARCDSACSPTPSAPPKHSCRFSLRSIVTPSSALSIEISGSAGASSPDTSASSVGSSPAYRWNAWRHCWGSPTERRGGRYPRRLSPLIAPVSPSASRRSATRA